MTAARPGFRTVPLGGTAAPARLGDAAAAGWVKRIAESVNNILKGKQNVVLDITLTAGAASTDIIDPRIGVFSALLLQPLTANAAAALYAAPYVIPSAQVDGRVTLAHVNDANTDKNFHLVILG